MKVYYEVIDEQGEVIGQFTKEWCAEAFNASICNPTYVRRLYTCPACSNFCNIKIHVIKHVRDVHKFPGLKNAKEFVEEWTAR